MQHDELGTKGDLHQLKQELVAKIDANSVKIDQLEEKLTARLNKLTDYAIENRERVGKMLTEERFKVYFGELMSNTDVLARSVSRGDQERTAMNARLGRVEEDVDKNKTDIKKIKTKLVML